MQKYPELTKPFKIFGIPLTPMCYYMDSAMTNAQIELLVSDVSGIDFGGGKDRKGKSGNIHVDKSLIEKANKEWIEKYGEGKDAGKGLSIQDILGDVSGDMTALKTN